MYTRQTFTKTERLCNKRLINKLFSRGNSFFNYPFKVVYCKVETGDKFSGDYPAKVLISVSKRNVKKAVSRNHIKRLIRESYRRNKYLLYDALDQQGLRITIGLIFTAKQTPSYIETEKKIIQAIHRLIQDLNTHKK